MPRTLSVCLASAALAAAAPVAASPNPLEPAFSNTLEMIYPDGGLARLWLDRDGAYRGVSKHGQRSSGRWSVRSGRLCMRQSRPFPVPFSYCTPLVGAEVGAAWFGKAVTGEQIRIRLVAGR